jgi:hypothetical protein
LRPLGYLLLAPDGGADSEIVGADVRPLDGGSTGSVVSEGGVGSLASDGGVEVLGGGSVDGGDDGGSVVGLPDVPLLGSGTVTGGGGGGAVVSDPDVVGADEVSGMLDGAPDPAGGTTTLGGSDDGTAAVGSAEMDASVDEDETVGTSVGVTGDVVPGSTVPPAELGTIASSAAGSLSAACEEQLEQTWTATASSAIIWDAAAPTESSATAGTTSCSSFSVSTELPVNCRRSTIAWAS